MKELSIEQKAKAYDEAKLRMSAAYNSNRCTLGFMNEIFPELKESEDEKIRKNIVTYLKSVIANKGYRDKIIESWIAWLENTQYAIDHAKREGFQLGYKAGIEKQGGQKSIKEHNACEFCEDRYRCVNPCPTKLIEEEKPADKVEPRFKVGDWVVSPTGVYWHIDRIENNRYEVTSDTGKCADWLLDTDLYHLWTIKDAKGGDVIYSRHNTESFEWIGIFKSLDKENKRVFFYGFWHNMAKTFRVSMNEAYVLYDDFSPATKEQRNHLFQKMKEAGYEWDAEKKKLRKIEDEQKPWSEEDEELMKWSINNLTELKDRFGEEYGKVGDCIDWLKSIKGRYTWKPSDEQTKALNYVINLMASSESPKENDYYYNVFKDLREQLKKLREE